MRFIATFYLEPTESAFSHIRCDVSVCLHPSTLRRRGDLSIPHDILPFLRIAVDNPNVHCNFKGTVLASQLNFQLANHKEKWSRAILRDFHIVNVHPRHIDLIFRKDSNIPCLRTIGTRAEDEERNVRAMRRYLRSLGFKAAWRFCLSKMELKISAMKKGDLYVQSTRRWP